MKFNNIQTYIFLFILYAIMIFFIEVIGGYSYVYSIFELIIAFIFSIINGSIIILSTFSLGKYKIYTWQKIIIWIISILTTFSILYSMNSWDVMSFKIGGYILDLLIACLFNIFILTSVFFIGNWFYNKIGNGRIKCPECAEMIKKDAKKCRFCGEAINKEKIHE
jgi:hypothetical protein